MSPDAIDKLIFLIVALCFIVCFLTFWKNSVVVCWSEYTHDAQGNVLTYKDSTGYWYEYTRDASGNELTYKNSIGYWHEYTRDASGNELTYKDSTRIRRGFD